MIVTRSSFEQVLEKLRVIKILSLDCETTGLRPYHGSKLFSIILGSSPTEAFYFNWWPSYPDLDPENVLTKKHLDQLKLVLFDEPERLWFIHNASFDMHMLWQEGIELTGEAWCTLTQGRVEYNEHMVYDLDACLQRIGLKKDDAVEAWIEANTAWEWENIPGKKNRKKNKFFHKVPWEVIVPYGLDDAKGGYALGVHQGRSIKTQGAEYPKNVPVLLDASAIEMRLQKTVFRMERVGIKIDRPYVVRAAQYESDRLEKASQAFKKETNRDYSASSKLFEVIFESEKSKWAYTDKGNPSFESDALKKFESPAAQIVLTLRDTKSRLDFYNGFLWHADKDDVIHPHLKPGGTRTFRFSSSDPNLQNLTSEDTSFCRKCKEWFEQMVSSCPLCDGTDIEHPEFLVRRAFVPRPGFIFFLPDYDQMEYKMMLDYAKHLMVQHLKAQGTPYVEDYFEVANKVSQGFDIHKATAELMGVPRKYAKTLNFLLLYGGGPAKLAAALGISVESAHALRAQYFKALPYVQFMIGSIIDVIKKRGWIRNWAGYKYNFPNREFAYTGPNTIIQGGCAAVMKVGMNKVDDLLLATRSRMVLTIHDEIPTEIHESEVTTLPKLIVQQMESIYPHRYVPLTVGAEWSEKSLSDKHKGYPA